MTVEALHACEALEKVGVSCDLIDLRTVRPIDWGTINTSVKKTGKLLVLDTGSKTLSVASEIVASVTEKSWKYLTMAPKRVALPDSPEPTSTQLTKDYYVDALNIVEEVIAMTGKDQDMEPITITKRSPHDVPGEWFKGPF
jgi:pyruvate dehydrogenase E1 component beta subunit